jgi:Na+/glutamate symporter
MGEGLNYFLNHFISRLRYCIAVTIFVGDIIKSLLCLTIIRMPVYVCHGTTGWIPLKSLL